MCFSATASLGLAGGVGGGGGAAVERCGAPRRRLVAAVPLLFGAKQVAEGTVWLTFESHAALHRLAVAAYLGVAFIVWPIWLPASLYLVERDATRRRVLACLL